MKILSELFFIIILISLSFVSLKAQNVTLGGGLIYGSEIENLGVRLDGIYSINEQFRVGADVSLFFPEKESDGDFEVKAGWTSVNINGHYLFVNEETVRAYLLAGLNIAILKVSFSGLSVSETFTGLNVGGGVEVPLEKIALFAELKAAGLAGDADQLVVGAGVRVPI